MAVHTVKAGSELTLDTVGDLAKALKKALQKPGTVTLDVSGVEHFDLAGLQLIYAFCTEDAQPGSRLLEAGAFRARLDAMASFVGLAPLPVAAP